MKSYSPEIQLKTYSVFILTPIWKDAQSAKCSTQILTHRDAVAKELERITTARWRHRLTHCLYLPRLCKHGARKLSSQWKRQQQTQTTGLYGVPVVTSAVRQDRGPLFLVHWSQKSISFSFNSIYTILIYNHHAPEMALAAFVFEQVWSSFTQSRLGEICVCTEKRLFTRFALSGNTETGFKPAGVSAMDPSRCQRYRIWPWLTNCD